MPSAQKKIVFSPEEISVGKFGKREAALLIISGVRHVHSNEKSYLTATEDAVRKDAIPEYDWEKTEHCVDASITDSLDRPQWIQKVLSQSPYPIPRRTREKLECILEELLTNGLFHAFLQPDGKEKYHRETSVRLEAGENISVHLGFSESGVLIRVTDSGGNLSFDTIKKNFERCYSKSSDQIATKVSGAGLGLYMVYEAASHLKIVGDSKRKTEITCWVAHSNRTDSFSFNFFEGSGRNGTQR